MWEPGARGDSDNHEHRQQGGGNSRPGTEPWAALLSAVGKGQGDHKGGDKLQQIRSKPTRQRTSVEPRACSMETAAGLEAAAAPTATPPQALPVGGTRPAGFITSIVHFIKLIFLIKEGITIPFHNQQGSERLSNLSDVTGLICSRAEIQTPHWPHHEASFKRTEFYSKELSRGLCKNKQEITQLWGTQEESLWKERVYFSCNKTDKGGN